jgi:hypothetical protein
MLASILSSDSAWALADLPKDLSATIYSATSTVQDDGSWGTQYTQIGIYNISLVKLSATDTGIAQSDSQTATWNMVCAKPPGFTIGGKVVVGSEEFECISVSSNSSGEYIVATLGRFGDAARS